MYGERESGESAQSVPLNEDDDDEEEDIEKFPFRFMVSTAKPASRNRSVEKK